MPRAKDMNVVTDSGVTPDMEWAIWSEGQFVIYDSSSNSYLPDIITNPEMILPYVGVRCAVSMSSPPSLSFLHHFILAPYFPLANFIAWLSSHE